MVRTLSLLLLFSFQMHAAVGVRLLLGVTDRVEMKWDGSVSADRGRILSIDGWRFEGQDAIEGASWRASTHRIRLFGARGAQQPPFVANGVIVWLEPVDENATLNVKTANGAFSVKLSEIPFGKRTTALAGRVAAERIPMAWQVTNSAEEQDYPAAAVDKNGSIWLAYVEFKHNPDHNHIRANFTERPANFDAMKAPPGGDQVFLKRFSENKWSEPIAISAAGGDLYRPAVAVDAAGRAWVFWSSNEKGNFDLWARAVDNGKPLEPVRITNTPGSDVFPVAASDAKGRVWVAWQGWRDGKAAIFASVQDGNRFSAPVAVSASAGNEWNPAIAADSNGRVTVAWDSYRNGNYDVFARTATAPGTWGKEIAFAASARYEAYPSIAYDTAGKLWVAYEEGAEGWGKDWGAYETSGVSLYQARAVRVAALDANGRRFEPAGKPGTLMPGPIVPRADSLGSQDEQSEWLTPNPSLMKERRPSGTPTPQRGPKNTMPRITVDASGRLWIAFRSANPQWWSTVGTVWTEYVVSCAGAECSGPILLSHTDNLLDNRPAIVSVRAGEAVVISASDGRRKGAEALRPGRAQQGRNVVADPYNNDLWASVVSLGAAKLPVAVAAAAAPKAGGIVDQKEQTETTAMRNYRVESAEGALRIMRGEFHRHSEVSMDGGNDGSLLEQWRYALDAAHMDWVGCCDHDNGGGREYSWWTTQKLTDMFYAPGRFSPMFSYERSVSYPEGHRNVVFVQRGVRPLPRLPKVDEATPGRAPDTQMFYDYLRKYDGIVASHTSGTNMGTDWRDNDPRVEPVVEIYQGDRQNYEMPGAPRSNTEDDSIGGWRPKGFVNLALEMGYKLGFQASSDHVSTHMSYCNILARDNTREAILDALKKRHVYGATDNILADVRSGPHIMGDVFSTSTPPELKVKLTGSGPFAKVYIVKDNKYVYTASPNKTNVEFSWRDNAPQAGKASYYYVRGEQADGEIVWASPMWITYTGK